jgi:hypothetical protein
MQFIYPGFLFASAAVLIPLIIHLFRFRRYRKMYFSNVRLIEDLQLEKRRRSRLKHILVLLARMFAILSLVFAFAQPYKPLETGTQLSERKQVVVYLDNSFSMETLGEEGSLLQQARIRAAEIVEAYNVSDRFALLTNDFEGRHQQYYSREEFLEMLAAVEISPLSRSLDEVLRRVDDLKGQDAAREVFLLSDFQRNFLPEASTLNADSALRIYFAPIKANAISNLYIDSVWLDSPLRYQGQGMRLRVRVVNSGAGDYEKIPLRLRLNGVQRAVATLDIPAGRSGEVTLPFTAEESGWYAGMLEITDYPVTFDDHYHFAFEVRGALKVLRVFGQSPEPYLPALFRTDSSFVFSSQALMQLDYAALASQDLIILENLQQFPSGLIAALQAFVDDGGSLVLFPGIAALPEDLNPLLRIFAMGSFGAEDTSSTRLAGMNEAHPLLDGVFENTEKTGPERVDLPEVRRHYPLLSSAPDVLSVMQLENGRPFLLHKPVGHGQVYLFTSALAPEANQLARHALVVPLLYRMGMMSRPVSEMAATVGQETVIRLAGLESVPEIIRVKHRIRGNVFIPEIRRAASIVYLHTHNHIREDGMYEVLEDERILAMAAFNYDRRESNLNYFSNPELEEWIRMRDDALFQVLDFKTASTVQALSLLNEGKRYFRWFLLAALLFLLTEVILLRFMKG